MVASKYEWKPVLSCSGKLVNRELKNGESLPASPAACSVLVAVLCSVNSPIFRSRPSCVRDQLVHCLVSRVYFSYVQYEDALESPLEKRISDSMVRSKDGIAGLGGALFSLVPSGVPKVPQTISEDDVVQPISSPDSFSDFFKVLCEWSLTVQSLFRKAPLFVLGEAYP